MPNVQFSIGTFTKLSEVTNSRRETWDPKEGLVCSLDVYLDWDRRYELMHAFADNPWRHVWPYTQYEASRFQGIRPLGHSISVVPVRDTAFSSGCQGIDYRTGIATLTYKQWAPVREYIEWQTQAIRLDPRYFKWEGATEDKGPQGLDGLNQVVHRLIYVKEYDLYAYGFPYNFFGTHTADNQGAGTAGLVGTIHESEHKTSIIERVSPGLTDVGQPDFLAVKRQYVKFPQESLLMLDPVMSPAPQMEAAPNAEDDEVLRWRRGNTVKMRWLYRPEGHNKFWQPDKDNPLTSVKGDWNNVVTRDGGVKYEPFPTNNHYPFLSYDAELQILRELHPPPVVQTPCPVWVNTE